MSILHVSGVYYAISVRLQQLELNNDYWLCINSMSGTSTIIVVLLMFFVIVKDTPYMLNSFLFIYRQTFIMSVF